MLYLRNTKTKTKLLILEPENIKRLQEGEMLKTFDGEVLIAYSPDSEWTKEQIAQTVDATPEMIERIIMEGLPRARFHAGNILIRGEEGGGKSEG